MKKLIIIPAYNEEKNIVQTVQAIKEKASDFDYIIINDCSTDHTEQVCQEHHLNYLSLPINLGIGGAVQTGYLYAQKHGYDVAVQVDGDGQHDPSYLSALCDELVSTDSNLVIGSRFIEKKGFQSSQMRRIGIKYFEKLIGLLTGQTITDPTSGFRMIDRQLIEEFCTSYPDDYPEPESIVSVLKRGYRVSEVPVQMMERQGGVSSISPIKSVYYMFKVSLAIIIARIGGN